MRENISHERVINKRPQLGIATKEVKSHVMQEIESLKLIFPDRIIGIPPDQGYQKGIQIQIVPEQFYEDVTVNLTISLQFPAQYPQHVPKIDFLESEGVTQLQMTEIFQELFDIALSLTGESMIYQLIVKCYEMVNAIHEQEYQNKLSSKNLHEIFIREEKQKKRQKHKQTKMDEHLEKENYMQQTADELELRQKWLQERDKLEEDNIEEPLPSQKVLNWQGLSNQDLLLIHLMKIVMKSQNYNYYKQAQYLLHQFQVTQTKEHIKLLSPKYEVLFNNIYSRRFEQLLKAVQCNLIQEQENIDYRLAELVNHSKPADKALNERSVMANVLFQPYYNSKQSNSFGMVKEPQQSATQNQVKISTNSSSRMETDFEIVEVLGKGAFGEVFKVKNKIDGRYYAIKKIKVPQGAALNRILREVDLLSRLHHRHVIRYYQAWIDECHQDDNLYFSDEEEDDLCLQSGFTQQTNSLYKMNSSYNDISQQQNQITLKKLEQTSGQTNNNKKILILFIQTEYCTKTLKESIATEYKSYDDAYIWTQFRQILEAMQYTHQQRIIHRDLKPENIFIDVTGDIKIGDFGLAKHTQKGNTNVIYSNSISDQQETDIQDILNYFVSNQICENDLKMLDKTLNVGTYFYCPPSSSTTYSQPQFDEKRDIYALGVILLEMWFQFQSNRERVKILGSLRKGGKLPKKFLMHHKRQAALITWMLDENPSNRPTIIQILESEYLPPRIEDEYFKEALKVITSSKDEIYYKQLVEAIFKNKHHKTILGANYIKHSNNSYTSQYLPHIIKHMQQQCVLQINTSIFIDRDKEQQLSLLNNFGEIIIFRSQLRQSFQKYLSTFNHKLLQSKTLKCFEIGEIFAQNDVLQVQQQLNFDQLIFNESSIASTLLNAVNILSKQISLVEQFHSIIKIKINYQPLAYELLSNLSIFDKEHIASIFKYLTRIVSFNNSLNFTKLKVFIQNDHEDPIGRLIQSQYNDKIDKILSIFTYKQILFEDNKDEIYNFEQILKQQDYFKSCSQDISDFLIQFSQLNILYRKLYPERCIYYIYDGSVNNQQYGFKNGFHFNIEIAHNNQIVYGGSYKKNFNKLQTICSVLVDASKSIDIKYDYFGQAPNPQRSNSLILNPKCDLPLSKIHSDSLSQGIKINQVQKQKVELSGYSINMEDLEKSIISKNTVLFKYQVLICSVGYNLSEIKKQFQLICLLNEIPTLMINDDDNQSFEDQILMAEKYDISLIIILRDKLFLSKGKAIVRQRKDKSKKDKEMTLEEFRSNLKIILKQ